MKYRHFPAAALAAGLLFCTLFSGLTAYADDKKSELTQKQTETRQEYETAQSALEELQNEQTQTEGKVAALTGQAAELAGQITAVTDAVQNAQTVLDERQDGISLRLKTKEIFRIILHFRGIRSEDRITLFV